MRPLSNRIVLCAGLALAPFLNGCHTPAGQSSLVAPLTSTSTTSRAGNKEIDLPSVETAKLCFATGESLEKGGKDSEAIGLYEKARTTDPRLAAEATRRLAVLYDRGGQFDKALDEYRRGLQENPRDAQMLNDLGYGYYCRGEWAAAETNLRKAVAINPKLGSAWNNLGMTLAQQGKYDESLNAFGNVVPKAQALCNLAFIQATQAKFDDAKQNYLMAIQLEPGLQIARIALQRMNRKPADPAASTPPTQREHDGAFLRTDADHDEPLSRLQRGNP